jgi:hypothetical protein
MSVMARTTDSSRRPVELVRYLPVPLAVAIGVLHDAPQQVIGSDLDGDWAGVHNGLGPELVAGRHLRREVRIGVGPLIDDDDVLVLPIWWEDADFPHLFPTFDGGLELRPDRGGTEVRLVGSYEVPLGALGRFADSLAGHHVVIASLETFLSRAAGRLTAVAVLAA